MYVLNENLFDDLSNQSEEVPDVSVENTLSEFEIEPTGPELGEDTGITNIIHDLIIQENEIILSYNNAAANMENYPELQQIMYDISGKEFSHIGELLKALEVLSPNAANIIKGEEETKENLGEDTKKKSNGKWVNKGSSGEHGEFKTKKKADAQRKAMFANGYKESLNESLVFRSLDALAYYPEYNRPAYLGAKTPEARADAFNEKNIPHCTRAKYVNVDITKDNTITVNWTTQEPFDDSEAEKLLAEVARTYNYLATTSNYDDVVNLEMHIKCRDGEKYGHYDKSIEIYSPKSVKKPVSSTTHTATRQISKKSSKSFDDLEESIFSPSLDELETKVCARNEVDSIDELSKEQLAKEIRAAKSLVHLSIGKKENSMFKLWLDILLKTANGLYDVYGELKLEEDIYRLMHKKVALYEYTLKKLNHWLRDKARNGIISKELYKKITMSDRFLLFIAEHFNEDGTPKDEIKAFEAFYRDKKSTDINEGYTFPCDKNGNVLVEMLDDNLKRSYQLILSNKSNYSLEKIQPSILKENYKSNTKQQHVYNVKYAVNNMSTNLNENLKTARIKTNSKVSSKNIAEKYLGATAVTSILCESQKTHEKYQGWAQEDIDLYESIDWSLIEGNEYDAGCPYLDDVKLCTDDSISRENTEFHKFFDRDPCIIPYYKCIEIKPFLTTIDYIGPIASGNYHKDYKVLDQYDER